MLQKPNTVFVGTNVDLTASSLSVGEVFLTNATTGAVLDIHTDSIATALGTAGNQIKIGFVKADGTHTYSMPFAKTEVKSLVVTEYSAKQEAVTTINFTAATITAGYRYVVRCIYKDIYEHPGQFTHSYEVVAASGETIDTIIAKFITRISAHVGARVTATSGTHTLILTAKDVTANGFGTQGKEAITPYSQVNLKVVTYTSIVDSRFNSAKDSYGATVTATYTANPGKGNAYIVRDREQAALAYKGITNRITWPIIKPELMVDLTAHYDAFVIEIDKKYQSPDNQYVKSTAVTTEVYVVDGATSTAAALATKISAWIA